MNDSLQASAQIRSELASVSGLREQARSQGREAAVQAVKRLQAQRFERTYVDFLANARQGPATRFFLDELYGDHDFDQRDAQFGRIAGAIDTFFPQAVANLAVDLARMHALTETLDHEMGVHWLASRARTPAARYVAAWRSTGRRDAREHQLRVVQHMGTELQRLTRSKSLLLALRMMRRPAAAAGLSSLQQFLEHGFEAFATLGDATDFLQTIETREQQWIDCLFDEASNDGVEALQSLLAGH